MAGNKYLRENAGMTEEVAASQASAGAGDAGKIPALDANGVLSQTMMPPGVVPDTQLIVSSENLATGDLVNVYNNGGTANVRKADATSPSKEAMGFVLAATVSPAPATVYFEGNNTGVTGLTPGKAYLSATTPGRATATPPSAAGQIVQAVGYVTGTGANLDFQAGTPILKA